MSMEFTGVFQEVLRLATHAPSGRPRFITQAIRRSFVVGLIGLRYTQPWRQMAPVMTSLGFFTIVLALFKCLLGMRGLSQETTPLLWMTLHAVMAASAFAFLTLTNPIWRRARLIL